MSHQTPNYPGGSPHEMAPDPPEKCDASLTIKMPHSLKRRIVERARSKRRSTSRWAVLVFEHFFAQDKDRAGHAPPTD